MKKEENAEERVWGSPAKENRPDMQLTQRQTAETKKPGLLTLKKFFFKGDFLDPDAVRASLLIFVTTEPIQRDNITHRKAI